MLRPVVRKLVGFKDHNFLASNYDIRQHQTLLKINLSYLERFLIKQFITAIENVRLEIY